MAVAVSVRRNAENRKIPNPSLTASNSKFILKCELEGTLEHIQIEKKVKIRYNLSAGSMSVTSVWQDFVLVFRKC